MREPTNTLLLQSIVSHLFFFRHHERLNYKILQPGVHVDTHDTLLWHSSDPIKPKFGYSATMVTLRLLESMQHVDSIIFFHNALVPIIVSNIANNELCTCLDPENSAFNRTKLVSHINKHFFSFFSLYILQENIGASL